MNESKPGSPAWVDPDDAPEITEEQFARGTWRIGERVVTRAEAQVQLRRGRPPLPLPPLPVQRPTLNMRIDADVLAALKATGPGWQTRINALLREAVEKGRVKS